MIFETLDLPGRTVKVNNGNTCLWFGGTDYLGMGNDQTYQSILVEGMKQYGTHYGSSRQGSLRIRIYEEAEEALAAFAQAPCCLTLSSGMLAGHLVHREIVSLARNAARDMDGQLPIIYHYAPGVHPTIWGLNYRPSTKTWQHWALETIQQIDQSKDAIHLICTDTIGSPWVEAYDFTIFEALRSDPRVWLVADDSHGVGVTGPEGKGVYKRLAQHFSSNLIIIGSLNKALGIPAGAIWASESSVAMLRRSPWFAGASPALPAYLYALKTMLEQGHYSAALNILRSNIDYFNSLFQVEGLFNKLNDYPVYCTAETALFDFLLQHQIMGTCFSYPTPQDPAALRLVISSLHLAEDLEKLAFYCQAFESSVY